MHAGPARRHHRAGLLLGTIGALAYTVMTAMPTAVDFAEIDAVDKHFGGATADMWKGFTQGQHFGDSDFALTNTWQNHPNFGDCDWSNGYDHEKCWSSFSTFQGGNLTRVSPYTDGSVIIGKYGCAIRTESHMPWYPISARLGNMMSDASTYLLISVILSTVFVISLTTLSKIKRDPDSQDLEVPEHAVAAWFFWGQSRIPPLRH